ncbi:hypothetical protein Geob_2038 [Geotalea daltonii FRC-32]|uniref:DUF6268 domain-containing protein n=1 Tax=Geotalea daltonii (strain DSM 22248 / JCM 15807 / FRC-32) TaxID=316067 RepID=B9M8P8_GEODF|nr:DUF6268 family outer membrane beta-barrel protein [Geotalea daltonii]ACM20394.1 hypothetical protein Geob_2038 [Geotalea daltonii FRC-32]
MKSCCRSIVLCSVFAMVLTVAHGHAADSSANETAKELLTPPTVAAGAHPWRSTANLTWLPDSDIRNSGGKLAMEEVEATFGRSYFLTPDLTVSTEAAYSLRNLDGPAGALLPEELHTFSVKLEADYHWKPDITLTFLVAPGLNGDFREIGTDDIRTQMGVLGRYNLSEKLILLAGLIYQQGYEKLPLLPVAGLIYRPNDQWMLSLAAPRPGITFSPNRTSSYYIGGEISGTEYQLHDKSIGAEKVLYRDFRAFAGAEYLLFSAVKVNLSGGYALNRKFLFYDGARDDLAIADGPFARVGVSLNW